MVAALLRSGLFLWFLGGLEVLVEFCSALLFVEVALVLLGRALDFVSGEGVFEQVGFFHWLGLLFWDLAQEWPFSGFFFIVFFFPIRFLLGKAYLFHTSNWDAWLFFDPKMLAIWWLRLAAQNLPSFIPYPLHFLQSWESSKLHPRSSLRLLTVPELSRRLPQLMHLHEPLILRLSPILELLHNSIQVCNIFLDPLDALMLPQHSIDHSSDHAELL